MRRRRRGVRRVLLGLIVLLYAISIPWYRPPGRMPELVGGVPDWFAVALGCYALAALLNAIAWWLTDMEDPDPPGGEAP